MEVEGAGGFEDAVELEQAVGHHGEVGHHVVLAQEGAQSLHHLGHVGVGLVEELVKFALGLRVPVPRVLEGFNLRLARLSLGRFEQEIVVALGIERRVEVDEVNRFGRNVVAEDVKVVAVIELIHGRRVCAGNRAASIPSQNCNIEKLDGIWRVGRD